MEDELLSHRGPHDRDPQRDSFAGERDRPDHFRPGRTVQEAQGSQDSATGWAGRDGAERAAGGRGAVDHGHVEDDGRDDPAEAGVTTYKTVSTRLTSMGSGVRKVQSQFIDDAMFVTLQADETTMWTSEAPFAVALTASHRVRASATGSAPTTGGGGWLRMCIGIRNCETKEGAFLERHLDPTARSAPDRLDNLIRSKTLKVHVYLFEEI